MIYDASLASVAGVKEGDVVTKVGRRAVKNCESLADAIAKLEVGDFAEITIKRNGKSEAVRILVSDGNEVRRRSKEAKEMRAAGSQENLKQAIEAKEKARQAAIAEDPDIENRLRQLLDEWELVKDGASDIDKAAHCKMIEACYVKLKDKDEYLLWSKKAHWYIYGQKTSGGF